MRKIEFINALAQRLSHLPRAESDKIISYYSEIIEDRIEDGMDEAAAISALGSPEELAENAMLEMSLPILLKANAKKHHDKKRSNFWLISAIAGSPVWVPLAIVFAAVAFVLYLTVWLIIVSFFIALGAIGISGVISTVFSGFIWAMRSPAQGILVAGGGLFLTGLSLILIKPLLSLGKSWIRFTDYVVRKIKSRIIKQEGESNEK